MESTGCGNWNMPHISWNPFFKDLDDLIIFFKTIFWFSRMQISTGEVCLISRVKFYLVDCMLRMKKKISHSTGTLVFHKSFLILSEKP